MPQSTSPIVRDIQDDEYGVPRTYTLRSWVNSVTSTLTLCLALSSFFRLQRELPKNLLLLLD